jgi:hypothetical protein
MYIIQPLFSVLFIIFPLSISYLHSLHMTRRKGKRKASPSPAASSSSDNDEAHLVHKRSRRNSPARVRQVALAKVASKSNSSSKGLAGFAALVNKANLSAAQTETSRGLRSSSSSKFHGVGVKSRDEKTVRIFFCWQNLTS